MLKNLEDYLSMNTIKENVEKHKELSSTKQADKLEEASSKNLQVPWIS